MIPDNFLLCYTAGINFYVIAMNFLAAVESGFLRDIPYEIEFLSGEERRSDFCYSIEECRRAYPQAMDVAKRFYQVREYSDFFFPEWYQ